MRFTALTYLVAIRRAQNEESSAVDIYSRTPFNPPAIENMLKANRIRVLLEARSDREGGDHWTHGFIRRVNNSRR